MTVAATSEPRPAPIAVHRASDILGWALPLYLLVLCGGFALLRSPVATTHGGELSIDRAAFTAMNAGTCTGFAQSIALDGLTPIGRAAIITLIATGATLTLSIGGTLVSLGLNLGFRERTIVITSIAMIASAALIGAATLSDSAAHGAVQGIGAIGNCGLIVAGSLGGIGKLSTWTVILPLSVIGGFGAPVVLDIGRRMIFARRLSSHSSAVLISTAVVYLLGTVLFRMLFTSTAANASAMAINSRSAGFDLVTLASFTRSGMWMIMAMMALGAAPGGSGGGLKVTLPMLLWRGAVRGYRGDLVPRSFAIALAWLGSFSLIVFVGTIVLTRLQPQVPGDGILFLVISAAANVGLSSDPVTIVGAPLVVLGAIAVVGRAMPFAVLWWWNQAARGEANGIAVG